MRLVADLTSDRGRLICIAAPDPGDRGDEIPALANGLKTLTPHFRKTDPPGGLTAPLSWPLLVQLRAQFGNRLILTPDLDDWITGQLLTRTDRSPVELDAATSDRTPYPWQLEGAALIAKHGRVQLHDDPGTGKTGSAVLGLVARAAWPALIVAPASVVQVWADEFAIWAPEVRVAAYLGPKRSMLLGGNRADGPDVLITSYRTFTLDRGKLTGWGWKAFVLDEFHAIKNHQSQQSIAVRRFATKLDPHAAIVGLSGTPITHHAGQVWPMLNAMEPAAYPSRERFVNRYVEQTEREGQQGGGPELGNVMPWRREEFDLAILGQHRRIAKADVLADLPPKVYSVRKVELPERWLKAYRDLESKMLADLPDNSEQLAVMDVLAMIGHLARLASSAADVRIEETVDETTGEIAEHIHLDLREPSWKIDAAIEILDERRGHPVVLAAASKQLIMLAGCRAEREGRRVGYVVGGQSLADRAADIARFQAGELDVMCLTTGAGREGITLTAAGTLVFLQRPWALVDAVQTEDRLHRIGAKHESIEIIDLVATGTIDERIRVVLRQRGAALSDLLADPRIAAEMLGGNRQVRTAPLLS